MDPPPLEPLTLDRELRAAARRWQGYRRRLRAGDVTANTEDPFIFERRVSTRSTFVELGELPVGDPIVENLRRWVYRLSEQRINQSWLEQLEHDWRHELHPLDEGQPNTSLKELLRQALGRPEQRKRTMDTLFDHSAQCSLHTCHLWERRQEIAVRMGLATPDDIELPCQDVYEVADDWLRSTDSLVEKNTSHSPADFIGAALGTDCRAEWPGHLTPETLLSFFRKTRLLDGLALDPGRLPCALAPTSFVRGLARLGAGFADCCAPRDQPFSVAHDPYGLARYRSGALFALLPLERSFLRCHLSLGRQSARDEVRALGKAVLLATRVAAMRLLLRHAALAGRDAFETAQEELGERALGVLLPRKSAGCLVSLRVDDPQRLCGLLLGAQRFSELVGTHDEDWFDNPRAADQLRSEANLVPDTVVERAALDQGAATLRGWFKEIL